jgi:hypothetical protein
MENNPKSGFVSPFPVRAMPGYPRKINGFSSCGEYARIWPRSPKYGRFAPRQTAINGLWTAPVSATDFSPSDPEKGRRNANMRVVFPEGVLKNRRET